MARMADSRVIGERLRLLRIRKGEAVRDICLALGITPAAYGLYEAGDIIPRGEVRRALAMHHGETEHSIFYA